MEEKKNIFKSVFEAIGNFFKGLGEKFKNFFKNPVENSRTYFRKNAKASSLASSIISVLIGIVAGFVVMLIIAILNKDNGIGDAFSGLRYIFTGAFSSKVGSNRLRDFGNTLFYATPLIMTGLSVAIAYKTGLFNIGAPGQFIMGTIGCLIVALNISATTRFGQIMVWVLAVIVGALCGMLWGLIPGILKAFFNINEVIICIMTNWIAANISTWIFSGWASMISQENTKSAYLRKTITTGAFTPKLGLDKLFKGSYLDIGIFVAILLAILVFIILNKTTFGFQLKACGANKEASKYAGLNEKKYIIYSMAIAGALAGIGAALYYLNPGIEYKYQAAYSTLPDYGFTGIAAAFLANCDPVGTIATSVLIRYLKMGGDYLVNANFNRYIADIIIAIIIYVAGFTRIIRAFLTKSNKATNEKRDGPLPEVKKEEVAKNE